MGEKFYVVDFVTCNLRYYYFRNGLPFYYCKYVNFVQTANSERVAKFINLAKVQKMKKSKLYQKCNFIFPKCKYPQEFFAFFMFCHFIRFLHFLHFQHFCSNCIFSNISEFPSLKKTDKFATIKRQTVSKIVIHKITSI